MILSGHVRPNPCPCPPIGHAAGTAGARVRIPFSRWSPTRAGTTGGRKADPNPPQLVECCSPRSGCRCDRTAAEAGVRSEHRRASRTGLLHPCPASEVRTFAAGRALYGRNLLPRSGDSPPPTSTAPRAPSARSRAEVRRRHPRVGTSRSRNPADARTRSRRSGPDPRPRPRPIGSRSQHRESTLDDADQAVLINGLGWTCDQVPFVRSAWIDLAAGRNKRGQRAPPESRRGRRRQNVSPERYTRRQRPGRSPCSALSSSGASPSETGPPSRLPSPAVLSSASCKQRTRRTKTGTGCAPRSRDP